MLMQRGRTPRGRRSSTIVAGDDARDAPARTPGARSAVGGTPMSQGRSSMARPRSPLRPSVSIPGTPGMARTLENGDAPGTPTMDQGDPVPTTQVQEDGEDDLQCEVCPITAISVGEAARILRGAHANPGRSSEDEHDHICATPCMHMTEHVDAPLETRKPPMQQCMFTDSSEPTPSTGSRAAHVPRRPLAALADAYHLGQRAADEHCKVAMTTTDLTEDDIERFIPQLGIIIAEHIKHVEVVYKRLEEDDRCLFDEAMAREIRELLTREALTNVQTIVEKH